MQSELYIKQAVTAGAELVLLPEFFTSAIGFSKQMLDVPCKNEKVHEILVDWSARYNVLVTPVGNFGIALCWEMIRYDTLKRINNADIILSGSCWWDLPKDASPEREPLRKYNQQLALQTPATFAKLAGIPLVHANHCGEITGLRFPDGDKTQVRQLVGGTQIVDMDGVVLDLKKFSDGAGFIIKDIPLNKLKRNDTSNYPSKYWIPDLPESYINAWEKLNPLGEHYYTSIALPH